MVLLWQLSRSFYGLGEYETAVIPGQERLILAKAQIGEAHPETLSSMSFLACAYHESGTIVEAIALHEEALVARRAELGENHRSTLTTMNYLANSYTIAAAMQSLNKCNTKHPITLATLAMSHWKLGNTKEAVAYRDKLNEAMKLEEFKNDHDRLLFAAEVEELLEHPSE